MTATQNQMTRKRPVTKSKPLLSSKLYQIKRLLHCPLFLHTEIIFVRDPIGDKNLDTVLPGRKRDLIANLNPCSGRYAPLGAILYFIIPLRIFSISVEIMGNPRPDCPIAVKENIATLDIYYLFSADILYPYENIKIAVGISILPDTVAIQLSSGVYYVNLAFYPLVHPRRNTAQCPAGAGNGRIHSVNHQGHADYCCDHKQNGAQHLIHGLPAFFIELSFFKEHRQHNRLKSAGAITEKAIELNQQLHADRSRHILRVISVIIGIQICKQ